VLLSLRYSAEATILPVAREALAPDWQDGRGLLDLLERFAGSRQGNDPAVLMAAYEQHNATVRRAVPAQRLIEWQPADGWAPLCHALGAPAPDAPFSWLNERTEWNAG
jgi:hypothetical protein